MRDVCTDQALSNPTEPEVREQAYYFWTMGYGVEVCPYPAGSEARQWWVAEWQDLTDQYYGWP